MPFSRYCKIFPHPSDPGLKLLFSTRTTTVLSVPVEMIRDIEQGDLSDEEKESLTTSGIIAESHSVERQEMLAYIDQMNAASRILKPIVVMNLDCNLACAYCFEGTRKGKYFLTKETAENLHEFVSTRTQGKDEISITFYGGEPLLSSDMILHISERMKSLAESRGISYGFNFITNGTLLTRRIVEALKPAGLKTASVTLDGPREVHDRSRPFKSGAGSFDTIIRNLQDVCDVIEVHVGGNFTRTNYPAFPGLLDALIESGLGPGRIASVCFDPVFNAGEEFCPDFRGGCLSANEPWLAEAGTFLRREILSRGFRTEEVQPAVCMIERRDHLVVNYDGALYKCPGLIGRKEYSAGTLKTGMRDYGATHHLGHWKNEECLACCYLPLCFGGCRYLKLLGSGDMEGVDCKKEFFDGTLQSLVLQDVKHEKTARTK